jgi:hypothetical protein
MALTQVELALLPAGNIILVNSQSLSFAIKRWSAIDCSRKCPSLFLLPVRIMSKSGLQAEIPSSFSSLLLKHSTTASQLLFLRPSSIHTNTVLPIAARISACSRARACTLPAARSSLAFKKSAHDIYAPILTIPKQYLIHASVDKTPLAASPFAIVLFLLPKNLAKCITRLNSNLSAQHRSSHQPHPYRPRRAVSKSLPPPGVSLGPTDIDAMVRMLPESMS